MKNKPSMSLLPYIEHQKVDGDIKSFHLFLFFQAGPCITFLIPVVSNGVLRRPGNMYFHFGTARILNDVRSGYDSR